MANNEARDTTPCPAVLPSELLAVEPNDATVKRAQAVLDSVESTVLLLEALAQVLDSYEAPAAASLLRSIRPQMAAIEVQSM